MAKSKQRTTFEKRRREREKQEKREEKRGRRQDRKEEKDLRGPVIFDPSKAPDGPAMNREELDGDVE